MPKIATKNISPEIKKITKKIVQEYNPEKIILFGSYAWGNPDDDSDLDLFIIKKSNKRRIDRARELRSILFGNNFPPLDLFIYTPEEIKKRKKIGDFFILDIIQKGKIIYG